MDKENYTAVPTEPPVQDTGRFYTDVPRRPPVHVQPTSHGSYPPPGQYGPPGGYFTTYPPTDNSVNSSGFTEVDVYSGDRQILMESQNQAPRDWLAMSIFVTVCCCLPIGIAAIVFAVEARSAVHASNFILAHKQARMAKVLSWVAFGIGIALIAGSAPIYVVVINGY